ncbi:hypothetical protein SPSIL_024770 [Sporomusa silvacetica DSM 10669]|uniref:Uncharacterized protein n=1 Tax=Sporomusa silvacetica DSM 10669 TaxID=1123289 RepID=A0ABZ3ILH7_9FIRM|nr:hypothetical protein SPSIL_39820 [Sporomusa silvacetica DSM 10669]
MNRLAKCPKIVTATYEKAMASGGKLIFLVS